MLPIKLLEPVSVQSQPKPLNCELTLSLALGRVATLPAGGLLQVIRLGSTAAAQSVRLITTLTER